MPELDYPVTHPASVAYKGGAHAVPSAGTDVDFPVGHAARAGANVRAIDTPDGQRDEHNEYRQDLHQLAMMGSLPPVIDTETNEPLALSPEQLAHIYAVRKGLDPHIAAAVTIRYGLTPEPARAGESAAPAITAEDQALAHIISLGYTPERAREILAKYGVPDIVKDHAADENR